MLNSILSTLSPWAFNNILIRRLVEQAEIQQNHYPQRVINILMSWLIENLDCPYPTHKQKIQMVRETGLTKKQLKCWFIDARRVHYFDCITLAFREKLRRIRTTKIFSPKGTWSTRKRMLSKYFSIPQFNSKEKVWILEIEKRLMNLQNVKVSPTCHLVVKVSFLSIDFMERGLIHLMTNSIWEGKSSFKLKESLVETRWNQIGFYQ